MQIIKDKHIVDDTWQTIADDATIPAGDVIVSLERWQREKHALTHHAGKLGVRLSSTDAVTDLADDLTRLELIELDFSDFADGRPFSQAWLLRERLHYGAELRATGHYMPDQVFYLARVGVNAFSPEKFSDLPIILAKLNDFTVTYQKSVH
ncbi:MAG: hypothetical protein CG439_2916 [Methylococcaceae bacterium NSP1-2]|nr:DUF934 domain-containing protein [Methylococcaceae bacterium]OYV15166.1 MAG: hypothetical protein CG439_2916 [Methylococcaceae bacterium NSP1-2]